jgi:hypothetical protein
MSSELTKRDYINILKYYHKSIPKSITLIKKKAENIMAEKLCKCIKQIDPINESKSIAICTQRLFNKRGYQRGRFTCIGKRKVDIKKNKTRRYRRYK